MQQENTFVHVYAAIKLSAAGGFQFMIEITWLCLFHDLKSLQSVSDPEPAADSSHYPNTVLPAIFHP